MHLLNKMMKLWKVTFYFIEGLSSMWTYFIFICGITSHDFTNSNSTFSIGIICSLFFLMYSVLSLLYKWTLYNIKIYLKRLILPVMFCPIDPVIKILLEIFFVEINPKYQILLHSHRVDL